MEWEIKSFEELSLEELYEILKIRVEIFVVEQDCPYPEVDGKDQESWHLIGRHEGDLSAYARLLPRGLSYNEAAIGRVLVDASRRGSGAGRELMNRAVHFFEERNEPVIRLQAQEYAEKFYASFGFERISDVYLEDNIPHVDMTRRNK